MSSSRDRESVARYFETHAEDFDSIYSEDKSAFRRVRDRLSRGTVVERLRFLETKAAEWRPESVLDVGVGSGRIAIALARQGARVVGIDVAEEMLRLGTRLAEEAGVGDRCTFLHHDLLDWTPDEQFDLTVGIGLYDYLPEAEPMLERMARVTKGRVVASFPKLLHPLVPIRAVRLRAAGCPVVFYRRAQIEAMAARHLGTWELLPFHRDYLLVGSPA